MKKIVPIITLILAIGSALLSVAALVSICAATAAPQTEPIAAAAVIASLVVAAFLTPFAYLFKKDVLCKIAMFIDIGSLCTAIISIIVWLTAF